MKRPDLPTASSELQEAEAETSLSTQLHRSIKAEVVDRNPIASSSESSSTVVVKSAAS